MSTAFTNPTTQSWQTLLSELTLAYSERRQSLGQSVYTPTAAKNVQSAAYWAGLQSWLESNCTSFIDHVSGPLNAGGTDFLYFTPATWRSAAGLNASGFRRSTDHGASFSYGNMVQGDYIDSWIFEDLQKGFAALKWVAGSLTWTRNADGSRLDTSTDSLNDAISKVQANWPGATGTLTGAPKAWGRATDYGTGDNFVAAAQRLSSTPSCATKSFSHSCLLYMRGSAPSPSIEGHSLVYNDNGDGITQGTAYILQQTSSSETGTSWDGDVVGAGTCPIMGAANTVTGYTSEGIVLIKYDFTNS
jgi:hypothetical protein